MARSISCKTQKNKFNGREFFLSTFSPKVHFVTDEGVCTKASSIFSKIYNMAAYGMAAEVNVTLIQRKQNA